VFLSCQISSSFHPSLHTFNYFVCLYRNEVCCYFCLHFIEKHENVVQRIIIERKQDTVTIMQCSFCDKIDAPSFLNNCRQCPRRYCNKCLSYAMEKSISCVCNASLLSPLDAPLSTDSLPSSKLSSTTCIGEGDCSSKVHPLLRYVYIH
jgi:hypothetical protein